MSTLLIVGMQMHKLHYRRRDAWLDRALQDRTEYSISGVVQKHLREIIPGGESRLHICDLNDVLVRLIHHWLTMDTGAHGMRDIGACRVQGIVDIKPDNEAIIFLGFIVVSHDGG